MSPISSICPVNSEAVMSFTFTVCWCNGNASVLEPHKLRFKTITYYCVTLGWLILLHFCSSPITSEEYHLPLKFSQILKIMQYLITMCQTSSNYSVNVPYSPLYSWYPFFSSPQTTFLKQCSMTLIVSLFTIKIKTICLFLKKLSTDLPIRSNHSTPKYLTKRNENILSWKCSYYL